MRRLFAVAIVLLASLPVLAQEGLPKVEIFGGYQYVHLGSSSSGIFTAGQGFNGWTASGSYRLHRYLGVEGDVGGGYASVNGLATHIYTYTAGPGISASVGPLQPFAHVLAGGAHFSAGESGASVGFNGFAVMAGGGIDYKAAPLISIRVIQLDWLYYHFGNPTLFGTTYPSANASNNVRIATGIVLRF